MKESRITTNPAQCGGSPCIRGVQIRAVDILDLLSNGLTIPQIIEVLPDLETEDVVAAVQYARENAIECQPDKFELGSQSLALRDGLDPNHLNSLTDILEIEAFSQTRESRVGRR